MKVTPVVFHVLLSLVDGHAHAYGIMQAIPKRTEGALRVPPGSLHYTLAKLLEAGWIAEAEDASHAPDANPRRRYYSLTARGREALSREATLLAEIVEFARERDLVVGGRSGS
jgi:DNA-binding PadR family transcriptional regulator